jgi:hypothetical protein
MRTMKRNALGTSLGDVIAASCELGSAVSPEQTMAAELAARHIARVLVQGGNSRLTAALVLLADELSAGAPRFLPSPARRPTPMLRADPA